MSLCKSWAQDGDGIAIRYSQTRKGMPNLEQKERLGTVWHRVARPLLGSKFRPEKHKVVLCDPGVCREQSAVEAF